MHDPMASRRDHQDGVSVSIKLRVSECFCREHHAPAANRLIDDYRAHHPLDSTTCKYIEHESGPELIVYAAVLGVAKGIIELIIAILNARREGRKQGDCQHGPLVIVVRSISPEGSSPEKQILKVDLNSSPTEEIVGKALSDAIQAIAEEVVRNNKSG